MKKILEYKEERKYISNFYKTYDGTQIYQQHAWQITYCGMIYGQLIRGSHIYRANIYMTDNEYLLYKLGPLYDTLSIKGLSVQDIVELEKKGHIYH